MAIHVSANYLTLLYIIYFPVKFFLYIKHLNLVDASEDFIFSGKAFHIITPEYDQDL